VTTLSTFNNLNQLLSSEIEGADGSSEGSTHIRGRVVDKNVESVTVNGIMATIEGETYSVEDLPLQPGENAVVVEAVDKAGNTTSETFTLFFDPKARATYRYDLNGNLIQKTEKGVVWRYEWDAENRLTKVKKTNADGSDGVMVEYGYFDNGNRAWKRVTEAGKDPVTTNYVHDGIHVIAEYNGEGELLKEYVYSDNIDEVINIKDVSKTYYPHQDGLNSVVAVTDADGERVASYNYEAFGTIKDATGALGNPITYTGRWIEPETGDYFYRARYYDSNVGRFLKRDPIGFESKDYNFYRYVFNNVQMLYDPLGFSINNIPNITINIHTEWIFQKIKIYREETDLDREVYCYEKFMDCVNLDPTNPKWRCKCKAMLDHCLQGGDVIIPGDEKGDDPPPDDDPDGPEGPDDDGGIPIPLPGAAYGK
jgi:RHS repeat-associated protein